MKTQEMIVKRINEITNDTERTICDICLCGGITPSTIYDILSGKSQKAQVLSIKKFCEGSGYNFIAIFR